MDFFDGPTSSTGNTPVIPGPNANPHSDPNADDMFGPSSGNNNNSNGGNNSRGGSIPKSSSSGGVASAMAGDLPSRADIKTQEQLMADSIAAIESRGAEKYDQLQEEIRKRTSDQDAKSHDAEQKMQREAADEIKNHIEARDNSVTAAKKTHAEAQKKLLSEMDNLEKQGSTWELAAKHCDLGKPNARAAKSTDKMRKVLTTLVKEPNVPIGAEGSA